MNELLDDYEYGNIAAGPYTRIGDKVYLPGGTIMSWDEFQEKYPKEKARP